MKILFVCTGNTCRSPMAEAFAQDYVKKHGLDVICKSAGLAAFESDKVSENTIVSLAADGLSAVTTQPIRFTRELGEWADVIYVMSEQHLDFIKMRFSEFADKTKLLGEGIPDPYGKDLNAYSECYRQLKWYIREVFDALRH
ncbi:MAG TPA: low molecular weight protein arginine phosphatase [Oscillospiraceae bacterium]|nr:low molecular weight protein arginine phosphatase [Oscillospiraceae bacterium]HPS34876.1 low molecular weight protein arginine phosphatase [Oscillospiraceae bacterium]